MGKRKKSSRVPQGPRKRDPLPTIFKCVFCSHETGVSVKIDKKLNLGELSCKFCGQKFQSPVNSLSAPVDVYSEWIDACEALAQDTATTGAPRAGARPVQSSRPAQNSVRTGLAPGEKYTAEDDGFIDDDEVDAEADYQDDD